MNRIAIGLLAAAAALILAACSGEGHGESSREGPGEHGGAAHDQSGEESAAQYAKSDTYDRTRNGARLILSYDSQANAFTGTVENTTNAVLGDVRVEIHLSNGIELGPTQPGDLAPGERRGITLPASDEPFTTWNAHPEVGRAEANHASDREAGSETGGRHGGSGGND